MPKEIHIPFNQLFNEADQTFIDVFPVTLKLEHSLVSLSKWESIWQKPFISKDERTVEETLSYIECMTMNTKKVDPNAYKCLTPTDIDEIIKYIESPMTATTFNKDKDKPSKEIVTSELIYYWMIAFNIPSEYEKWHLNRLLTLIKICGIKNEDPKKMSKGEIMNRNRTLNEARRKAMHSKG